MIMKEENISLWVVNAKQDFIHNKKAQIAYRYLFWACVRGYTFIVNYLLH